METIIATTILESIGKRLYNLFEDVVKGFKMDNDVNLTKIEVSNLWNEEKADTTNMLKGCGTTVLTKV